MTIKVRTDIKPYFPGPLAATLIALFRRDKASDPSEGLLDIALVAGNKVDMGVGHNSAGRGMDSDTHNEIVGVKQPLEDGFDLFQEDKAVRFLLDGQVKVIGTMPGGDHQEMHLTNRKPIKNRINHSGFRNRNPKGGRIQKGQGFVWFMLDG